MAHLWSIATATPPHTIDAEETRRVGRALFASLFSGGFERYDQFVENSRVRRRHLVRPVEDLIRPRGLGETSTWYREAVTTLGRRVLDDALSRAGVSPAEIDALVVCNATGVMIPSLDAYLVNQVGLRPTARRLPFATLGCAGGAGGLIRAAEAVAARGPDATVAMVTVEAPTLTFRPGDQSIANAISSVLFGDGAAALVLRGRPPPGRPSLRVRGARTSLQPDSYDAMAFHLADDGFQVVLSPDVPERAPVDLVELIDDLCREAGATRRDLRFFAVHPGGTRVLERVTDALGLTPSHVRESWEVLAAHGNMSAPTVLFVLERVLRRVRPAPGALGLIVAFGPGFSTEMALLESVGT